MNISWLFEIGTYKWSTKAVSYSAVDYTAKIFPDSFGGVSMGWDIGGNGLIYPTELSFEIDNADDVLSSADLEGESCTIKLITDGTQARIWKFEIQTAVLSYGKISVSCVGILQKYLDGDHPNTPHPRETWVSAQHETDDGSYDDYRIPVIFGTAYLPLMYIYHTVNETGYYVLGSDEDYTIEEVKAPPDQTTVWESSEYTFTQTSDAGYKLAEFEIAPTETPGTYENGTWASSKKPLVKYSETTGSTSLPATILIHTLQDFGVPNEEIDYGGTFTTAAALFAAQGITWNGGWYEVQDREDVLSELLAHCDSTLYQADKIELYQFSKTSKETFDTTKTIKNSFKISRISQAVSDSGHVAWASEDYAQNNLVSKTIVPINSTTAEPYTQTLELKFIQDDVVAQKLGILYFQKKLAVKNSISFESVGSVMSTLSTLKPGDVVTVDDAMFGGSQDIVITELEIEHDLTVNITGKSFTILQEFDDLSASAIPVTEDTVTPLLGQEDSIFISGDDVFKFLAGQSTPVSSPIVLTAALRGDLTEYDWEYWTGTEWANLSGTQDEGTYSLAHDNAAWGTDTTLRIRCLSGVLFAEKTISKIYDGTDGTVGVDAGNWSSSTEFSATDYNTVAWSSSTIITAGAIYSIVAGNTGNMTAATPYYIYLKPSVSTTVLQVTTTASSAVGADQILVGVAQASTSPIKAGFQVFGGRGGVFITADNIAAGSITADKIVSNSLTSTQINTASISIGSWSGAGDLAGKDTVGDADITSIAGGKISTGVITGSSSGMTVDLNNNKINFTSPSSGQLGVIFGGSGSILSGSFPDTSDIEIYSPRRVFINAGSIGVALSNVSTFTGSSLAMTGISSIAATTGNITTVNATTVGATTVNATSFNASSTMYLKTGGSTRIRMSSSNFYPNTSNGMALGGSSNYWSSCRITTGYITTVSSTTVNATAVVASGTSKFGGAVQIDSNNIYPYVQKGAGCGASTRMWSKVYSYVYYDDGGGYLDTYDDLELLANFKSQKKIDSETGEKTTEAITNPETGGELLDLHSLPKWVTNYADLREEVRSESGDMISDEDFDELIKDPDELGYRLGRNIGHFNDLTNGAVRQLDIEIKEMYELLAGRLTALETKKEIISNGSTL